jgi:hypothetical protein
MEQNKKPFISERLLLFNMVTRMGFEPMNAAVKGRCVKPLHQRASLNIKWWA